MLRAAIVDLRPLGLEASSVAPRLPVLEQLLARADVSEGPPDWRGFVAAAWSVGSVGGALPVAATIAAAAGLDTQRGWYVATPVHLVAGLNHVRLHPAGPLALDVPERQALVDAHARDFAGTGTALVMTPWGLLWHGAPGPIPHTRDPDPYTGQDIEPALPAGEGSIALRRDMTELQMWLHEAPFARRAALAPNGLWLWGGSAAAAWAPAARPVVDSTDAFLAALGVLAPSAATGDAVVTYRFGDLGAQGDAFALAEARYFAPLAASVARARHARTELWFGGRVYRLARHHRLRLWRRSLPWWHGEPA